MFEKRTWVSTDSHPGASDLNRIENGIEDAHKKIDEMNGITVPLSPIQTSEALIVERVKSLPQLASNAKPAEIAKAYNDLLSVLQGSGYPNETKDDE